MIKTENVNTVVQTEICDVCGNPVGELQRSGDKSEFHFCFACGTIGWAVKELINGRTHLSSDYYQKGCYKFDHTALIKTLLVAAKEQTKNGKF